MRSSLVFLALLLAVVVVKAKKCQLEEQGWCTFEDNTCTFSDVYRLPTDKSSPLEVLLDKNIRSKEANNGCPLPQPLPPNDTNRKPFVIEIEPCFSNGTATPANLKACPDIPDEYFEDLGKRVLGDDGTINEASGAIMGIPIEFNVLNIGKALVLDNMKNTKNNQAQNGVKGTLLSKFRWRTLPLTSAAYAKAMEEASTVFVSVSKNFTKQLGLPTNSFQDFLNADNKNCMGSYNLPQPQPPIGGATDSPTADAFQPFEQFNKAGFNDAVFIKTTDPLFLTYCLFPYWNQGTKITRTTPQDPGGATTEDYANLMSYYYSQTQSGQKYDLTKLETCMISLQCVGERPSVKHLTQWQGVWPLALYDSYVTLPEYMNVKNTKIAIDRFDKYKDELIKVPGCKWESITGNRQGSTQPGYLNIYSKPKSILQFLKDVKFPNNKVLGGVTYQEGVKDGITRTFGSYTTKASQGSSTVSLLEIFGQLIGRQIDIAGSEDEAEFLDILQQAGNVQNLQLYATNVKRTLSPITKQNCPGVSDVTGGSDLNAKGAATLYLLAFVIGQIATGDKDGILPSFFKNANNRKFYNETYGLDLGETYQYLLRDKEPLAYPFGVGPITQQKGTIKLSSTQPYLENNPDLASVAAMFFNILQPFGLDELQKATFVLSDLFVNADKLGVGVGKESYFFIGLRDCMVTNGGWDPFSCVCFPATITPEQCASNLDTPTPLDVVVGKATRDYKNGQFDPPPVSLLPYSELTCPLEVNFADDRTPDMSPKKQRDNVYVESSSLIADIPTAFESVGRGCYMCFANQYDNLTKTLEDKSLTWLQHYHPQRCRGRRAIPTVKSTSQKIYDEPTSYEKGTCGKPGDPQQTDPLSLYLPGRDFSYAMNQPLGVYTLYPYFELEPIPYMFARNVNDNPAGSSCPKSNCGPDDDNFKLWERNLARQIAYYLNPDWWVTVEVVGMEKAKGSQVLRNFHGRIIEEGLVDFDANLFTYNILDPNLVRPTNEFSQSIHWENYLNPEKNPFFPGNCIFDTINMDTVQSDNNNGCISSDGKPEALVDGKCAEVACESDIPGDTAYNILSGNLTINYNIDIGDMLNGFNEIVTPNTGTCFKDPTGDTTGGGYVNPYKFLVGSTETAGGFVLPSAYDGITNDYVQRAIDWVVQAPLVRRKDGICIDRPGQIKIEMPFAAQCLFGLDTEKTTRSIYKSSCQPEKAVRWYSDGGFPKQTRGAPRPPDIDFDTWVQPFFLEVVPTGIAKDILDVFDSVEFKLALALLAFEDPAFAEINDADIVWCLSPLGPTSPLQIIEFLLLFCQACTPGSDSSLVRQGVPGECFTYEGGAPCLGYVGPPAVGPDRNTPGWASVTVSEFPIPCMFEQVAKVIRPAKSAESEDDYLFDMCDRDFLKAIFEYPYYTKKDKFPKNGPGFVNLNDDTTAGLVLSGYNYLDNVPNIVDEINIMGVTIESALFSRADPSVFPNGLFMTSTHPLIHTKISRDLGSGDVRSRGCNVVLIGMPDVSFYNVEFDNSACQEQGLNQLTYESANDFRAIEGSPPTLERAFKELKAWNMAPVHITNLVNDYSPTNLNFTSIKLTAATSFRRMYPGRPLMSIDNDGAIAGAFVNVDKMFLSEINDTHKYRDTRDVNSGNKDPVDLMPLHIIFWHTAGEVTLGVFPDELDVVTFSERDAFKLDYQISSTQETDVACKGDIKSPAAIDAQNGNTLLQYKTKCLSLDCEVQFGGKRETNWAKQKENTFCRKVVKVPIVNNIVVLDGNDFFDM